MICVVLNMVSTSVVFKGLYFIMMFLRIFGVFYYFVANFLYVMQVIFVGYALDFGCVYISYIFI